MPGRTIIFISALILAGTTATALAQPSAAPPGPTVPAQQSPTYPPQQQQGYPQQQQPAPQQPEYPQQQPGYPQQQPGYPQQQQPAPQQQPGYPQQQPAPQQQPGYPQQQPGYPQQQPAPQQPAYPQQQPAPQQPGYPQQQPAPQQPAYPQQQPAQEQPAYPQQPAPAPAPAPEPAFHKLKIGFMLEGLGSLEDSSSNEVGLLGYGIFGRYRFSDRWEVEAGMGKQVGSLPNDRTREFSLFSASALAHMLSLRGVDLYLRGGLGRSTETYKSSFAPAEFKALHAHIGGGAEYVFRNHIGVMLELRLLTIRRDADASGNTLSASGSHFGLGAAYYF